MMECAIPIGNLGLETWWQVAIVASAVMMYIMANIIPAAMLLFTNIIKRKFTFETPLFVLFLLIPIIGSIMGLLSYKENGLVHRIFLALAYIIVASFIACIVETY